MPCDHNYWRGQQDVTFVALPLLFLLSITLKPFLGPIFKTECDFTADTFQIAIINHALKLSFSHHPFRRPFLPYPATFPLSAAASYALEKRLPTRSPPPAINMAPRLRNPGPNDAHQSLRPSDTVHAVALQSIWPDLPGDHLGPTMDLDVRRREY